MKRPARTEVATRPRKGVDHELRVGSSAHYEDPAYYAQTYADRRDDIECYVALALEHGGREGPVLEYGCGAGRICIPIARAGVPVVGVDLSAAMLGDLARRLAAEPREVRRRVSARRGDMRSVRLTRKFPLVLATFNTFLHLYTRDDVERFLARVRQHLAPGGRFVFDTLVPSPADLGRDPSRAYRLPPLRHPTLGVRCKYAERFDYEPIRQVLFVAMEVEPEPEPDAPPDETPAPFMVPLAHRQFFPAELEALLHYNGFEVVRVEGGFRGEPADRHADSLLWTCMVSKARGAAATTRRAR